MLTLADVVEALTGLRPALEGTVITEAVIDSRQVIPGSLFVALPGERVDGHDYVRDAFTRGASFALIQHPVPGADQSVKLVPGVALDPRDFAPAGSGASHPSGSASTSPNFRLCLMVENTLTALQQIARFWRQKLDLRVVGITGSVGKSTTKEVIAEVLEQHYRTLKSPGNMNNEIGLPLTILKLGRGYERAVLEMGFYVPGEIALLCDIARPEIGVVTNIGTVHAERAGSQEEIFRGKSELVQSLPASGVAILNRDDALVSRMAELTKAYCFLLRSRPFC